jgi:hypothetical protein
LIVYGDPQFEEDASGLITRLRNHARGLRNRVAEPSLDDLRGMLIQAGQLEQAGWDELPRLLSGAEAREPLHLLQSATDLAAAAFYARWRETQPGALAGTTGVTAALAGLEGSLGRVPALTGARLTVKVPEGFAFYALYPEQYAVSALRWHADRQGEGTRRVAVVGIRSIGTTLSAVVAEVLKAAGWQVSRQTVRPSGHPFSREVAIEPGTLGEPAWGLVVDEGPGLSGSSLAATAEALCSAGLARSHISFLASHEAAPAGASEPARSWWQSGSVYATPFQALRWCGRTIPERLAARCGDFGVGRGPAAQIEDCGGGQWRGLAYPDEGDWPAVAGPFERTKYRCTRPGAPAVLWKFAGQACLRRGEGSAVEAMREALAVRAQAGWTPAPLDTMGGFIALPWVEGAPLRRVDGDPVTLAGIGRYIREVAGSHLQPAEQETALRRLEEILYWNTWESLGEERAAQTRSWVRTAVELCGTGPIASYGDGRLAPLEWRRAPPAACSSWTGWGTTWITPAWAGSRCSGMLRAPWSSGSRTLRRRGHSWTRRAQECPRRSLPPCSTSTGWRMPRSGSGSAASARTCAPAGPRSRRGCGRLRQRIAGCWSGCCRRSRRCKLPQLESRRTRCRADRLVKTDPESDEAALP